MCVVGVNYADILEVVVVVDNFFTIIFKKLPKYFRHFEPVQQRLTVCNPVKIKKWK